MTDADVQPEPMTTTTTSLNAADVESQWRACLEPQRPHDELSFDELALRYNFRKTSDRRAMLVRLIINELKGRPGPTRVLHISAGKGSGAQIPLPRAIAHHCDERGGVRPAKRNPRPDGP